MQTERIAYRLFDELGTKKTRKPTGFSDLFLGSKFNLLVSSFLYEFLFNCAVGSRYFHNIHTLRESTNINIVFTFNL
jgi:hypothetical protein